MAEIRTYFSHTTAAERYAHGRPYFHPIVIDRIRDRLGLAHAVGRALDVACGTGQSTQALATIANRIVGIDLSLDMLTHAPRDSAFTYAAARAEMLPFSDACFDLATVSLAVHWFDQPRFFAEVHRVLRPGGWLVIYQNGFAGHMRENSEYERWNRERYVQRYPTPPRNPHRLDDTIFRQHGFEPLPEERYANDVTLTPRELVAYLLTQSNVIARVEHGGEPIGEAAAWLEREVTPMFTASTGTFSFGGNIRFARSATAG